MNKLIIISTLLLVSCGSLKKQRTIDEEQFDGLKFESLKRFNSQRLGNIKEKNQKLVQCHQGKTDVAFEDFKAELDKSLNNYLYWNQISTCYILKKEYTKALNFLNLALATSKTKEQKAMVLNNMGVVHLEQENFPEAKEYFKKSTELSPHFLTPQYNLTQIYLKFGFYNKSRKLLTNLLNKNKNDIDFLHSYAYLELMTKNYKSALVFFNKIPEKYKYRDDIATNMAMTYYMLGLYENSLESLNDAPKSNKYFLSKQMEIKKRIENMDRK